MHKIKHIGNTIVELLTNTYANHASMLDLGCPSYPHVAGLNQHVTEEEARLKQKHYFISFNTITSWEQIDDQQFFQFPILSPLPSPLIT